MSTHASIGIENGDGSVDMIYLHSDGYLERAGVILQDYWTTREQVRELIGLGDLSILGREIGEKHDFGDHYSRGHPRRHWCKFYGRDRNEYQPAGEYASLEDSMPESMEYYYLFTLDGKWMVNTSIRIFRELGPLVEEIKQKGSAMIE